MGFLSRAQDAFQCGAYLTDSWNLFEIVDRDGNQVTLENCVNGGRHTRPVTDLTLAGAMGIKCKWRVVRKAPEAPDYVGDD